MRIKILAKTQLNRLQGFPEITQSIEKTPDYSKQSRSRGVIKSTQVPKVIIGSTNLIVAIMLVASCLFGTYPTNCSIFDLQTSASNHTSYFLEKEDSRDEPSDVEPPHSASRQQQQQPIRRSPFNATINNQIVFDESEPDEEDDEDGGAGEGEEEEDDDNGANQQDEEDVEEEDNDDFYGRNPVELAEFEAENDKELNGIKFNDFDDYKALGLNKFYAETMDKKSRRKQKPKQRKVLSNRGSLARHKTSASSRKLKSTKFLAGGTSLNECAMFLAEGATCLTFGSIEWAIRAAKRLLRFRQPDEEELNSLEVSESTVNSIGELIEQTTRLLARRFGLTVNEINFELERQVDVRRTSLWQLCPQIYRRPNTFRRCSSSLGLVGSSSSWLVGRFRSYTGMCNNQILPHFGASLLPFVRLAPPSYFDSVGEPRRLGSSGLAELPNPRLVALSLHLDLDSPSGYQTALFAQWGQLINHDLALASGARGK